MIVEYYDPVSYVHKVLNRVLDYTHTYAPMTPDVMKRARGRTVLFASTLSVATFYDINPPIWLCTEFSLDRVIDYVARLIHDPSWIYGALNELLPAAIERTAGDRAGAERHLAWALLSCPSDNLRGGREKFIAHFNVMDDENWRAGVVRAVTGLWWYDVTPVLITPEGSVERVYVESRLRIMYETYSQRVMKGRADGMYELITPLMADVTIGGGYRVGWWDTVEFPQRVARYIFNVLHKYGVPVRFYQAVNRDPHSPLTLYIPYDFIRTTRPSCCIWLVPRYGVHTKWPSFVVVQPNADWAQATVGVLPPSSAVRIAMINDRRVIPQFPTLYSEWCRLVYGVEPTWWKSK